MCSWCIDFAFDEQQIGGGGDGDIGWLTTIRRQWNSRAGWVLGFPFAFALFVRMDNVRVYAGIVE